ncbi:MAG: hypothetical protein U0L72_00700 [Acutalibacteraceae bacterium]|nr:hypothetical protein [Acutalibacteraceae bacterium]
MSLPKIPDDIYENRCRYCMHHIPEKENREIKSKEVYRNLDNPCVCKIQSIAQYKYQEHDKEWRDFWYVPYEDGECRSFTPNYGYPICHNCEYSNQFRRDSEYCTKEPKNRKVAVIGNNYGTEYWKFAYMICDKWKMDSLGRHKALERVAEGKLPQCFDPETYKLLNPTQENKAAERWSRIIKEHKEQAEKAEQERKEKEQTDDNGQYKMF